MIGRGEIAGGDDYQDREAGEQTPEELPRALRRTGRDGSVGQLSHRSKHSMEASNVDSWYIENWQHLMGALDAALEDARGNAALLRERPAEIDALLARAEQERAAAETVLHDLAERRRQLAATLDEVQRDLAIAGVPLRGEIS